MVAGRLGKLVDDRLVDREPVADPDLLPDKLRKICQPLDLDHPFSFFGIGAAPGAVLILVSADYGSRSAAATDALYQDRPVDLWRRPGARSHRRGGRCRLARPCRQRFDGARAVR